MICTLIAPRIDWSGYNKGYIIWVEYSKQERYIHYGYDREKLSQLVVKKYPPKIIR